MAHLLVSRETVIDQENSAEARSSRGPGKHKRSPKVVLSNPLSSASKRRALAPITNQPLTTRERQPAKPKQAPTPVSKTYPVPCGRCKWHLAVALFSQIIAMSQVLSPSFLSFVLKAEKNLDLE